MEASSSTRSQPNIPTATDCFSSAIQPAGVPVDSVSDLKIPTSLGSSEAAASHSPSPATLERARAELSRFLVLRELVLKRRLLAFEVAPDSPEAQRVLHRQIRKMLQESKSKNPSAKQLIGSELLARYKEHTQRQLQQVAWAHSLMESDRVDRVLALLKQNRDAIKHPSNLTKLYAPKIDALAVCLPPQKKEQYENLGAQILNISNSYAEHYIHLIYSLFGAKSQVGASSRDIQSIVYLQLRKLVTQFPPELGIRFTAYVRRPLTNAILQAHLQDWDIIPIPNNLEYRLQRRIEGARQIFHNPTPKAFEVAMSSGCSALKARHAEEHESKIEKIRTARRQFPDEIPDRSENSPVSNILRKELTAPLVEALERLREANPSAAQDLLTFRLLPEHERPSLITYSQKLGISQSALRRRIQRALIELGRIPELKRLARAYNFDLRNGPNPSI